MFYFFIVNAVGNPMANLMDPDYFLMLMKKWFYKRQSSKCLLTQQEANDICEYPRHEIERSYADIMTMMYVTIFYSTVVPLGQIIGIVGLIFYYWVEKYIVLRRKTIKKTLSVHLSLEMTEYLEMIILIYSISSILFKYQLGFDIEAVSIITATFGCLYTLLPVQLFVDKFFLFEDSDETLDYEEARQFCFITDYELQNPITKRSYGA